MHSLPRRSQAHERKGSEGHPAAQPPLPLTPVAATPVSPAGLDFVDTTDGTCNTPDAQGMNDAQPQAQTQTQTQAGAGGRGVAVAVNKFQFQPASSGGGGTTIALVRSPQKPSLGAPSHTAAHTQHRATPTPLQGRPLNGLGGTGAGGGGVNEDGKAANPVKAQVPASATLADRIARVYTQV